MRQVFLNVFFYLEIVNKMRQVSITISDFTHSIKQPCGRCCDIKFVTVYSPQFSNVVEFILRNVRNFSQSVQAVKIRQLKRNFIELLFLMLEEGGEDIIYVFQFFSLFLKILTEAGRHIFL